MHFSVTEPEGAPAADRPLGGLLDLLLFLLLAIFLYLTVQLVAVVAYLSLAHTQQPGVPWSDLQRQLGEEVSHNVFFLIPVQLAYYVLLILALYLILRAVRQIPFWSSLGFRALPASRLALGFVLGFILAPVIQGANLLIPPPEPLLLEKLFTSKTATALILSVAVLAAPFVEELLFRGYIYTLLERLWGSIPAILTSGFLFGAIHFYQLWPGWFQMVLICIVGFIFSTVRARAGSTLASIAVHFGYNLALAFFFLLSPQFRQLPP